MKKLILLSVILFIIAYSHVNAEEFVDQRFNEILQSANLRRSGPLRLTPDRIIQGENSDFILSIDYCILEENKTAYLKYKCYRHLNCDDYNCLHPKTLPYTPPQITTFSIEPQKSYSGNNLPVKQAIYEHDRLLSTYGYYIVDASPIFQE